MGLIGERGGRSGLLPATQRWSHLQTTDSSAAESQADLQSAGGCWRSAREGGETKIRKPSVLLHRGVGLKHAAISAFVASGGSRTQLRLSSRCCESQFGDIAACRRPPVRAFFSPKSLPRHLSASFATTRAAALTHALHWWRQSRPETSRKTQFAGLKKNVLKQRFSICRIFDFLFLMRNMNRFLVGCFTAGVQQEAHF